MSWGVMAQDMAWGAMEEEWRKGPWTVEEDRLLIEYVKLHGDGRWNNVARLAGLKRNGKSCRLRWVNYLRPDLKKGQISPHEERLILELHAKWGNRWSTIARCLPGRTDNEIKNYWRTHFKKKTKSPSDNPEKTKARLLRKQQFQLQQQQQQLLQQQDQKNDNTGVNFTQGRQEIMLPSLPNDEEGLTYSMIDNCTTVPMASSEDDSMMWDGLWDFDEFHGNNLASSFY